MNWKKAQKIIFEEMLKKDTYTKRFAIDPERVFISPNGIYGFVLEKDAIRFNLDRIKEVGSLRLQEIVAPENLCKLTDRLLMGDRNNDLHILTRGEWKTYINRKYLQCFENPKFYQEKEFGMVVVTEDDQIVGAVMPVKVGGQDSI